MEMKQIVEMSTIKTIYSFVRKKQIEIIHDEDEDKYVRQINAKDKNMRKQNS